MYELTQDEIAIVGAIDYVNIGYVEKDGKYYIATNVHDLDLLYEHHQFFRGLPKVTE